MLYTNFTLSQQSLYLFPPPQGGPNQLPGGGKSGNGNSGNGPQDCPPGQSQPQPQPQQYQQNQQQPQVSMTPNMFGGTQMPQPQGGTMVFAPQAGAFGGNPFAGVPQPSPYGAQGMMVQPAGSLPGGMGGMGGAAGGGSGLEKMMSMMMMIMMCLLEKLGLTDSGEEVDLTGEDNKAIDPADEVTDPKDKLTDPDKKTDDDKKADGKKKDKIKPGEPGEITPGDESAYDDLIAKYARKYDVDPKLIKAVIRQSSDFDATAVSRSGRHGLMQLSESTAKSYGFEGTIEELHDPETNISLGAKRIKKLLDLKKDNVKDALIAYFGGLKGDPAEKPKGENLTPTEYATLVEGWLADLKAKKKLDTRLDAKPSGEGQQEEAA